MNLKTRKSSVLLPVFDPARYPRTYEFSAANRWTMVVFGSGLFGFAGWLAGPLSAATARGDRIAEVLVLGSLAAFSIWAIAAGLRTRAILSEGRLDYRGAFLSRSVLVADILGRRRPPGQTRGIQIEPRPGRGRRLRMRSDLRRDEWFDAWMARIPDLDAAEQAASLAQVLEDRELGATARDVGERLARAKLLVTIGTIASFVLLLELQWGPLLWDSPVDVAIAICVPVVALLAAGLARGLVTLTPSRNDARPSLFPMILLPSFGVLARLLAQSNFNEWRMLVLPALAAGALGAAYAMAIDVGLRRRIGAALGTMGGMGVFAAAAIVWLDVHADPWAAAPARVAVLARESGRKSGDTIRLGPTTTSWDWRFVRVTRADLHDLHVGDIACLTEHPGLFKLRWAELHRCAGDPPITPEQAAHHWLADIARPASQRPPLAQQLVDGEWQAVDARLNALQKRFENGDATAIDVEQAFIPLYNVEPALDAPLADWLAHAPDSWAARVAMALHTERQIEWLEGAGFDERDSPAFNWEERSRFALGQVQASMALSPRPALSLMSKYRLTAQRWKDLPNWVDRMIAIDPDDVTMRREYLIQSPICPCRGQSPDDPAMRKLLQARPSQRVRDALAAYRSTPASRSRPSSSTRRDSRCTLTRRTPT
jgi:hypothetical protein